MRSAVEAAKRDALEQVATYLENVTEVRNMDITRDPIWTDTAGIVKVLDQTITTMLDGDIVVIRADLMAQVDPNEVAHAISGASRERERQERAPSAPGRNGPNTGATARCAANQALADAASPEEVQAAGQRRQDTLNELQANALVSQAWTSVVYATPGFYSYPWVGVAGINGLLLQAQQGLYPRHRHLPLAQQMVTALPGQVPTATRSNSAPPRQSLLVPSCSPYASSSVASPAHTFRRARKSRGHRQHSAIRSAGHSSAFASATNPTNFILPISGDQALRTFIPPRPSHRRTRP